MIDICLLQQYAAEYNLTLTDSQLSQIDQYAGLLVEWNQKMNLTAITEPSEMLVKHYLDSLLLLDAVDLPNAAKVVDVGCGAGFPSMPCLIARPDLKLTLLDSLNKRLTFLKEVGSVLNLQPEYLHGCAEEIGRKKEYREQYQLATARAVAHLAELSEYCLPFVQPGGMFAALKGYDVEEELQEAKKAISLMGGEIVDIKKYQLPMDNKRSIVLIKKISQTSTKYPRISAKIAKAPIR